MKTLAFASDLRFAARLARRAPALAAAIAVTLALPIAVATAVGSAVDAFLLQPLPYPDGGRLVFVSRAYPGFPQGGGNFSYPALADIAAQNRSFDVFAGYQAYGAVALTGGPEPVRVLTNYVAPAYLRLLGMRPALGRTFRDGEDWYRDAENLVVLSDGFFRRQFGGARDLVGRRILFNGLPFTVIGIAPPDFRDALAEQELGEPIDAWLPLGLAHRLLGQFGPGDRAGAILWGIGRLKPGVSAADARADVAAIGERLAREYPETDRNFGLVARPLRDQLRGDLFGPLRLLVAGAAILLVIGGANAANLLLARLVSRRRELAVRAAHGATGGRLFRQIFAEGAVLAAGGGILGVLLGAGAIVGFRRALEAGFREASALQASGRALAAGAMAALAAAVLVGAGAAISGARVRARDALSAGARSSGGVGQRTAARALVVAQMALALVLLSGAGLLAKSLRRLATADLGFSSADLLTLRVDLRGERYETEESRAGFARSLLEELAAAPGRGPATLWGPSMFGRATWVIEAVPEGRAPDDPRNVVMSSRHSVNPGGLAALGVPILRGRDFAWADDARAARVAIVSQSTAATMWPGEDAVGKRFSSLRHGNGITVVGVARDARHRQRLDLVDAAMGIPPAGLGPQRDVYLPYLQRPNPGLVLGIRTRDAATTLRTVRQAVGRADPALPVYDVAYLDERLSRQDRGSRFVTLLAAAYAGVALLLAAVGLAGVLGHGVRQRSREIGIRRALGALPRRVLAQVVGEGVRAAAIGCGAGIFAALLSARAYRSLLFEVAPTDPLVLAAMGALLLGVAVAASFVPARRATRVDPLVALRSD